ncbi:MAG: hypothetical protein U0Q18_31865 [Bryobacteraceae bacterium]
MKPQTDSQGSGRTDRAGGLRAVYERARTLFQTAGNAHPGDSLLGRYSKCTLPQEARRDVERHLRACKACRLRYEVLSTQLTAPAVEAQPLASTNLLPEIMAAIRRHETLQTDASSRRVSRRRAEELVSPYLGPNATSMVFEAVAPDCQNLLSETEPVLELFLGRRAASRVASRIVEASTVRA